MKSVLLIGLGRFGVHIAAQLNQLGHQVMGVDRDENRINNAMEYLTSAQIGDSSNKAFLRNLGIGNYDVCIVAIGNDFQSSLETTSLLKELGAKQVVSRADRDVQEKFLLRNGADAVAYPEKQIAKWLAVTYTADKVLDYIELDDDHAIYEVKTPKEWVGKTIGEIDVRRRHDITIMATKRDGRINVSVTPSTLLTEEITLLVIGEYKDVRKCFKI